MKEKICFYVIIPEAVSSLLSHVRTEGETEEPGPVLACFQVVFVLETTKKGLAFRDGLHCITRFSPHLLSPHQNCTCRPLHGIMVTIFHECCFYHMHARFLLYTGQENTI